MGGDDRSTTSLPTGKVEKSPGGESLTSDTTGDTATDLFDSTMGDGKKVYQCKTCGSWVNSRLGFQRHAESHQPITLGWCASPTDVKMHSGRPGRMIIAAIWRCSINTLVTSHKGRCVCLTRFERGRLARVGGQLATCNQAAEFYQWKDQEREQELVEEEERKQIEQCWHQSWKRERDTSPSWNG